MDIVSHLIVCNYDRLRLQQYIDYIVGRISPIYEKKIVKYNKKYPILQHLAHVRSGTLEVETRDFEQNFNEKAL